MKKFLSLLALAVAIACAFYAPRETANALAVAAVLAVTLFVVANISRQSRRNALFPAINTLPLNVGSSHCSRRYLASGAVATKYFLGKIGADDEHVAVVAAASDQPIGVMTDESDAAEDPVTVELAGVTDRTLPLVAKVAIAKGVDVYSNGDGKVTVKPTAAGTYWRVGRSLTASGADGDPIEVALCLPKKLIVLAALTNVSGDIADTNSTATNPSKADFDSLLVAAGKLQADFLLLAAAVASGAEVDYATT